MGRKPKKYKHVPTVTEKQIRQATFRQQYKQMLDNLGALERLKRYPPTGTKHYYAPTDRPFC